MTIYYSIKRLVDRFPNRPDLVAINLYRHERYRMALYFWMKDVNDNFCVQHYGRRLTPREAWRMLTVAVNS